MSSPSLPGSTWALGSACTKQTSEVVPDLLPNKDDSTPAKDFTGGETEAQSVTHLSPLHLISLTVERPWGWEGTEMGGILGKREQWCCYHSASSSPDPSTQESL